VSDWLFAEQLTFGSSASRVGLVTLWTSQKRYRDLAPALYRVMGNLYSADGVNYIARNVLAHPDQVRVLVVCGSDGLLESTGVRQALREWRVTDLMIPAEAVDWLRANVPLNQVEMPDLTSHLAVENERVNALGPVDRPPAHFPFPDQTTAAFPSELTGMRVLWSSVYDAWIDALRHVLRFGVREGRRTFLLNLVSVIDGDDDRRPGFVSAERVGDYAEKFLVPDKDPDVTYTYGNRLLRWGEEASRGDRRGSPPGINLVEAAVEKLRGDLLSSRCVLDLWDNRIDLDSDEPPCLTQVIMQGVGGLDGDGRPRRLFATAIYRSHDLYRAYFLNLVALRRLQRVVADQLGWQVGTLTTISVHAHVYEWDLEAARVEVAAAGRPVCRYDPRGNLAFTQRDGQTVAILYAPDGRRVTEYVGYPRRILQHLLDEDALSQPSHWSYVTRELAGLHDTDP
jgi:thymidylate synthase